MNKELINKIIDYNYEELFEAKLEELKEKDKEIDSLDDCNRSLHNENKRLNNIIDELEKWIKYYIPLLEAGDIYEEATQDTLKEVLYKLNELKGDNK